ncbi:MAG TPA: YCF48-related protein [Terriglobales bacterium]|nr:YCF48-related protein [Terriglobales bacterium]
MSELPKIVLQRLRASAVQGEHPSADLLAAFAEQGLAGAEREKLLAHLAACEQCREVVWFAMPEGEAEKQVVVSAASGRWFWSSAWRWAGIAAGIVVIAGVAMLFRGGPGPAGEKVASVPQPPPAALKRDTQAFDAKQVPAPSREVNLDAENALPKTATGERLQAKDMRRKAMPLSGEPVTANKITAQSTQAKLADDSSSSTAALAASAPAPVSPVASKPNAPAPFAAKTAPPASAAEPGVTIASDIPARALGKKKLAPPTRWMLSADGTLMRSTDAGKNWQGLPFENNIIFHAVAVIGPRVWVGGQGGALYYSSDDGSRWQSLAPSVAGVALSEDITSLAFQDPLHGSLTTAGGQTWTTSDGGHSWQKQQ